MIGTSAHKGTEPEKKPEADQEAYERSRRISHKEAVGEI
jgi:hypothetical protein